MIENSIKPKRPLVFRIAKVLIFLLFIFAAAGLLIRFVVPVVLNVFWGKDIAPIDDSSMQLSVINLPSADNSFYDLAKIKNVVNIANVPTGEKLAIDFISSDSWDGAGVKSLLNDNQLVLQYFNDAASKHKFQSPETANPDAMSQETIAMSSWRQAAQLSCIQSIWLAKNGKGEEALKVAMTVMAVGDQIEKSQANLLTYLLGISLKKNALDTLQKVLSISNINQQTRLEYKNELVAYSLSDNSSIWKFEYLLRKNVINGFATGKYDLSETSIPEYITLKTSYHFKPNLSIKELFSYYSKLINDAKNPCTLNNSKTNEINIKLSPNFKWYFTENAVNKILMSTSDLALKQVLVNKCKIQQEYWEVLADF